jgi:hypothetical protein
MKELFKYHVRTFFKSNKIIVPMLLWLVYLRLSYSQKPVSFLPNIAMSVVILFFIMLWVGFGYMDMEDTVSEQLMILRVRSYHRYQLSKVIFLFFLDAIFGVIGILFPMFEDIFNQMFTYRLTAFDLLISFGLHCILGFLGAMVGAFFHPRIMKNRKMAILLALSVALIGYTKGPIITQLPFARFILWIFPPVYDILESFTGREHYTSGIILISVFYGCGYGLILMLTQMYLLKKNKF